MDRFAQFAMVAALEAVKDSGLDIAKEDPFRCGAIIGSGIGGLTEYEEQHTKFMQGGGPRGISPFVIPKMMPNAAPGNISIHFGLCRPEPGRLHRLRLRRPTPSPTPCAASSATRPT